MITIILFRHNNRAVFVYAYDELLHFNKLDAFRDYYDLTDIILQVAGGVIEHATIVKVDNLIDFVNSVEAINAADYIAELKRKAAKLDRKEE